MNKNIKQLSIWCITTFWACLIYFASSIPGKSTIFQSASSSQIPAYFLEWGYHFGAYAILTLLLWFCTNFRDNTYVYRKSILIFLIGFLYAISDEWHQSMVVFREASISDLFIDCIGCISGIICANLITSKFILRS